MLCPALSWLQIEQHVVIVFVVESRAVGRIISLAGVNRDFYVPLLEDLNVLDKHPGDAGSVWGSVQRTKSAIALPARIGLQDRKIILICKVSRRGLEQTMRNLERPTP